MNRLTKIMTVLSVMILTLAMISCFTACGAADEPVQEIENPITVTICIEYPDEAAMENVEGSIVIEEGGNVEDASFAYFKENDIIYAQENNSGYTYVNNIGGVSEGDFGGMTGWIFEKNGEMVMESSNICLVEDGDVITWKFVNYNDVTM